MKQKLPTTNYGYKALNAGDSSYGKLDERIYTDLASDHPIDLTRYQVANGYMGRIGLINSGGASGGNDMQQAIETAVINKRAGGMGLISGRKAFQKPRAEGVELQLIRFGLRRRNKRTVFSRRSRRRRRRRRRRCVRRRYGGSSTSQPFMILFRQQGSQRSIRELS